MPLEQGDLPIHILILVSAPLVYRDDRGFIRSIENSGAPQSQPEVLERKENKDVSTTELPSFSSVSSTLSSITSPSGNFACQTVIQAITRAWTKSAISSHCCVDIAAPHSILGCCGVPQNIERIDPSNCIDLQKPLSSLRIFHFTSPPDPRAQNDYVNCDNGQGLSQYIEAREFVELCKARASSCVQLVVLHCCGAINLAKAFVAAGFQHIVAINMSSIAHDSHSTVASCNFLSTFYQCIVSGDTILESFRTALAVVQSNSALPQLARNPNNFAIFPDASECSIDHHSVPLFIQEDQSNIPPQITFPMKPIFSPRVAVSDGFIGRGPDIYYIVCKLMEKRLLVVYGEKHMGKSELIRAVSNFVTNRTSVLSLCSHTPCCEKQNCFRDGVIIVTFEKLQSSSTKQGLFSRLRDVISHSVYKLKRRKSTESFVENTQNDIEFVTSYLQDCNVLVAIDECDNLMWDTQFHQDLEFLLRSCPGSKIIVSGTCPIPTTIPGVAEVRWRVGGLSILQSSWLIVHRLQFADPVTLKNVVLHEASLLESEFEVKSDVDQSVLEKLESPLGVVTEYLESGEETPKLLSLSVATDILSRSPSLHLLGGVPGAIIEVSRRLMATGSTPFRSIEQAVHELFSCQFARQTLTQAGSNRSNKHTPIKAKSENDSKFYQNPNLEREFSTLSDKTSPSMPRIASPVLNPRSKAKIEDPDSPSMWAKGESDITFWSQHSNQPSEEGNSNLMNDQMNDNESTGSQNLDGMSSRQSSDYEQSEIDAFDKQSREQVVETNIWNQTKENSEPSDHSPENLRLDNSINQRLSPRKNTMWRKAKRRVFGAKRARSKTQRKNLQQSPSPNYELKSESIENNYDKNNGRIPLSETNVGSVVHVQPDEKTLRLGWNSVQDNSAVVFWGANGSSKKAKLDSSLESVAHFENKRVQDTSLSRKSAFHGHGVIASRGKKNEPSKHQVKGFGSPTYNSHAELATSQVSEKEIQQNEARAEEKSQIGQNSSPKLDRIFKIFRLLRSRNRVEPISRGRAASWFDIGKSRGTRASARSDAAHSFPTYKGVNLLAKEVFDDIDPTSQNRSTGRAIAEWEESAKNIGTKSKYPKSQENKESHRYSITRAWSSPQQRKPEASRSRSASKRRKEKTHSKSPHKNMVDAKQDREEVINEKESKESKPRNGEEVIDEKESKESKPRNRNVKKLSRSFTEGHTTKFWQDVVSVLVDQGIDLPPDLLSLAYEGNSNTARNFEEKEAHNHQEEFTRDENIRDESHRNEYKAYRTEGIRRQARNGHNESKPNARPKDKKRN